MNIIDFHTHFFPENIQRSIYDWFDKYGWGIYKRFGFDDSLKYLKKNGIERHVVAVYAHKKDISGYLNSWLYDISSKHPEIIPLGTVYPDDDNIREISKKLFESYNFAGVKIHCHLESVKPEDKRLFPLYEEIVKYDRVLLLHGSIYPNDAGIRRNFKPEEYSGAEHVENLLKLFPDMKVVVAHLGMDEYDKFGELMDKYENLYLDTAMTHCFKFVERKPIDIPQPPTVEFMEKYWERILFGSDFPFIPYDIEKQIECIEKLNIPDNKKSDVFYNNARKILSIK